MRRLRRPFSPLSLPAFTVLAPLLGALLSVPPAGADTVTLVPSQDTTLYENYSDSGNGTGEWFFAGLTNTGQIRRSLVQFDLSGLPPGTLVQSASFKATLSLSNGSNPTVALHKVTESWTEGGTNSAGPEGSPDLASPGDATWEFRSFPNHPWATLGGTFVSTPSASLAIPLGAATYTWASNAALVADVQSWIDHPETNFGWLLKATSETGSRRARRFNSRSNSDPPQLVVVFVAAPFFADGFESGDTSGWVVTEP